MRVLLDLCSVILHIFSLPTVRLPAEDLYNLTKKSTAQSARPNCAVLPKVISLFISIIILSLSFLCFAFAGEIRNDRIVNALTPTGSGVEKYVKSFGTDYANAPTSPIIAEDYLIIFSGWKLYKLNKETGEEIASVKAEGRITFTTVSPLYYDGVVYMQLDNGIVQAFDFETLHPLWIYRDTIGGQALCPIRYDNGFIYTGFWDGETREANYVCLNTIDPDPLLDSEEKQAEWTYAIPGGFYRAGCSFTDKYIVFGCDDGARGTGASSRVTVLNKKTGEFVSSVDMLGDIRTDIVYDSENDAYYTATKSGCIYRFKIDRNNGKIYDLIEYNASGSVTAAPVIYKNRLYIGAQNGTEGIFIVLEAKTLKEIYSDDLPGYPQAGMLVSRGYENETGKVYVYTTYNMKPGGVFVFEDSAGQTTPVKREVYSPPENASQYCISQIVCDEEGTLYYKNDSGNIFAIENGENKDNLKQLEILLRKIFSLFASIFGIFGKVFK